MVISLVTQHTPVVVVGILYSRVKKKITVILPFLTIYPEVIYKKLTLGRWVKGEKIDRGEFLFVCRHRYEICLSDVVH